MPDIKAKSRNSNKGFNNSRSYVTNHHVGNKNGCNSNAGNIIGIKKSREIETATSLTGFNSSSVLSADNPDIHQQQHNGKAEPVLHY